MSTNPEETSGAARTPWLDDPHPRFPSLGEEIEVDVAVIGGGIVSLSTRIC